MTGSLLCRKLPCVVALAWALVALGCEQAPTPNVAWLLVDQDADPAGHGGHPGALFLVDPRQHTVETFCASKLWRDPVDVLQDKDGAFLVLDYHDQGQGGIFRVSGDGKKVQRLQLPEGLVDPCSFALRADGSIWIVDKNADPKGLGKSAKKSTGTLWRLSPDRKKLEVVVTGPPLMAPADICFVDDTPFLLDADAYRTELFQPEGAIFSVDKRSGKLETVVRPKGLVSPLSLEPWTKQRFLVTDVNADPKDKKRLWGGVYVVDPKTNSADLVCHDPEFRDPAAGTLVDGKLLLVDASADPAKLGKDGTGRGYGGHGRGALFEVDPTSGRVKLLCTSKLFVNPMRIKVVRR